MNNTHGCFALLELYVMNFYSYCMKSLLLYYYYHRQNNEQMIKMHENNNKEKKIVRNKKYFFIPKALHYSLDRNIRTIGRGKN